MHQLLRRNLALLSLAIPLFVACGAAREKSKEGAIGSTTSQTQASADSDSPVASFYGGDVERLRSSASKEEVLVHSGTKPFITAGEYNAWLGTYPLNITSQDTVEAKKQALEQMVTYKLLLRKAREVGYKQGSEGPGLDDKSIVVSYIRDYVVNIAPVTDEAARGYAAEHAAQLSELNDPQIPAAVRTMAIRGSVRGEQLWQEVKGWMKDAQIKYEDVR